MLNIKEAGEKDFYTIHELAHKIWPHTFASILSAEQISYMLELMYSVISIKEQVEHKGHHFIIAELEGTAVGYSSYETNYKNNPDTKIHKIYILPEMQGKGIGREMMNYIAARAKENNNTALVLNVNRYNKAVDFYKRVGFEIIGEEDIDIGNGYFMNDYVMRTPLIPLVRGTMGR